MQDISSYIAQLSYFGIFIWFLILEQLTPVPEEVYLMTVGYIAVHSKLNIYLCGLAALTGLITTDSLLFYISLKGNKFSQKLLNKINSELLNKIKDKLHKKETATIFVGALIPKLRFFNPLIAGSINISFKKFFLANAVATVLYVSVYMSIGIFFHAQISSVIKQMAFVQHGIFICLMIIIAIIIIFRVKKYFNKTTDMGRKK